MICKACRVRGERPFAKRSVIGNYRAGGIMNLRRAIALAVWWVIPVLTWSQTPSELKPVTDRLAASIYNGPSMATLGELADGIGGSVTGSPAYPASPGSGARKSRRVGLPNVSRA